MSIIVPMAIPEDKSTSNARPAATHPAWQSVKSRRFRPVSKKTQPSAG